MDQSSAFQLQGKVNGVCMLLAPVLLLGSSLALWADNLRLFGVAQVYAFVCFISVALGLTNLFADRMPRVAIATRLLLFLGCAGGIGYAHAYVFDAEVERLGATPAIQDEFIDVINTGLPLMLNLPGVVFPLTMAAVGITLWRTRTVAVIPAVLLVLASLLFPVSRIGDIVPLMVVSDALFVVSLSWIALRYVLSVVPSSSVPGSVGVKAA